MRSAYLDLLAKYGISSAHPGGVPVTKKVLEDLPIVSNTVLLDLGCGTGQTLAYIAKTYPCKLIGVDINDQMLFKASQRFKLENLIIDLVHADVMQLPFPSDMFDIALSESVTIFTNISRSLDEYSRVLKRKGILLAVEMTAKYALTPIELREINTVYGIEQVPTLEEWEKMFRKAGFIGIQSHEVKMTPPLIFISPKMMYDFSKHLYIMNRYGRKLGCRVYKCICN